MDVDCRWPGSVHDLCSARSLECAKVFANSQIGIKLHNHAMSITEQVVVPGRGKVPNYLIGDPAYPLTSYCIKEFEKCSCDSEVIFNSMLRSARNPVECAFGRLKARWSVLTKKIDLALEYVPVVIYACFVLHNYCEVKKCAIDPELVKLHIEKHRKENGTQDACQDSPFSGNSEEGEVVRDILRQYIEKC